MIREIFKDERGTPSAARVFLATTMVFTGLIIVLDSLVWDVPEPAYALLGSLGRTSGGGCGIWHCSSS